MRLQQIQEQITENNKLIKSLQSQITQLSRQNSELAIQRENKLIEYFRDYIELGTSYKVTNWMYLTGVQTHLKKDEKPNSPNFQKDEVFKFVKNVIPSQYAFSSGVKLPAFLTCNISGELLSVSKSTRTGTNPELEDAPINYLFNLL